MSHWPLAFFELVVVLAFGIGWMILEWQGRRLDRQRDERERIEKASELPAKKEPGG